MQRGRFSRNRGAAIPPYNDKISPFHDLVARPPRYFISSIKGGIPTAFQALPFFISDPGYGFLKPAEPVHDQRRAISLPCIPNPLETGMRLGPPIPAVFPGERPLSHSWRSLCLSNFNDALWIAKREPTIHLQHSRKLGVVLKGIPEQIALEFLKIRSKIRI